MADFTLSVEFDAKSVKDGAEKTNRAVASIGTEAEKTSKKTKLLAGEDLGKPAKSADKTTKAVKGIGDEAQKSEKHTESLAKTDLTPLKNQAEQVSEAMTGTDASVAGLSDRLGGLQGVGDLAGKALGAVTVVAAALAAAVVYTFKQLYDAGRAFADYGVKIGQIKAQTGLAAETISALGYQVTKSGGSVDILNDALVEYQKLIGAANSGSTEAIAKTKRLGIDTVAAAKDMDGALRQTLKTIISYPAGIDRTNAAIDAFGDKGKDLLPFLATFDGDLDGLIKKATALGVVLSENDVRAAQEFNKVLGEVQALVKGLMYTFGREALPVIKSFFEDFRGFLADNQDRVKSWATNVGDLLRGLRTVWSELTAAKREYFDIDLVQATRVDPIFNAIYLGMEYLKQRGRKDRRTAAIDGLKDLPNRLQSMVGPSGQYNSDQASALAERQAEMAKKFAEEAQKAQVEHLQATKRDLAAQISLYEIYFRDLSQLYDEKYRVIADKFKETNNPAQYQASFTELQTWFAAEFEKLLPIYKALVERQTNSEKLGLQERELLNRQTLDKINGYRKISADKARLVEQGITAENKKQAKERERIAKEEADRRKTILSGLEDQIRQFEDAEQKGINAALETFAKANRLTGGGTDHNTKLGYASGFGIDATSSRFVKEVNEYLDAVRRIQKSSDAFAEPDRKLKRFLQTLMTFKDGKEIRAFADEDISTLIQGFERLGDAITAADNAARQKRALEAYGDLMLGMSQTLLQLNNELAGNTELTEANRLAQMMATDAYKDLTDAQREALKTKAAEVDQAREALKAQRELEDQYREFEGFLRDSLQILAEDGFGAMFKHILNSFKRMLVDMAAQWLASKIFKVFQNGGGTGSGSGGGIGGFIQGILQGLGIGGRGSASGSGPGSGSAAGTGGRYTTPSFNPNAFTSAGGAGGLSSFGQNLLSPEMQNALNNGGNSTSQYPGSGRTQVNAGGVGGGMFGPVPNLLNGGKPSAMAGAMSGVGAIASMVGGFVPGRLGNTISMAGTGMSIGAMFGPWGAAIGAVAGGLLGFFGYNDPKRKADKNENMPKLQEGFTDALAQLKALANDRNAIYNDPSGTVTKALELRAQIASGFGIQFQSKKYKAQAKTQIDAKLVEADAIIKQLQSLASGYGYAKTIDDRLETSFASGVFMSKDFMRQFSRYKRRNGMLQGSWTGTDTLPSMLAAGEMVLNPRQIATIQGHAGFDVFKGAGIPGYAKGIYVAPSPASTRMEPSATSIGASGPITVQIVVNNSGMTETDIKDVMVNGMKQADVQVELVKAYDKGKSRGRG